MYYRNLSSDNSILPVDNYRHDENIHKGDERELSGFSHCPVAILSAVNLNAINVVFFGIFR
jgi:hypothetical protein